MNGTASHLGYDPYLIMPLKETHLVYEYLLLLLLYSSFTVGWKDKMFLFWLPKKHLNSSIKFSTSYKNIPYSRLQ